MGFFNFIKKKSPAAPDITHQICDERYFCICESASCLSAGHNKKTPEKSGVFC